MNGFHKRYVSGVLAEFLCNYYPGIFSDQPEMFATMTKDKRDYNRAKRRRRAIRASGGQA